MTLPSGKNRRYLWYTHTMNKDWDTRPTAELWGPIIRTCSTRRGARLCKTHPATPRPDGCMTPCWYRHLLEPHRRKSVPLRTSHDRHVILNAHNPSFFICYHQNGHVASAGTSLSRICRVRVWCSSVPILLNRPNAKSRGPWTESDDKWVTKSWEANKQWTNKEHFIDFINLLCPNLKHMVPFHIYNLLTLHKYKSRGTPATAVRGLACPDRSTQPSEIHTSGSPAATLQWEDKGTH